MCCLLTSCKIQVPTKKLVSSIVLDESIGYIETANQQMSKQENETEITTQSIHRLILQLLTKPHK